MAKNKITIDVEVNGKMEKATLSTKKLRRELSKADKAQQGLSTSTRKGYRASQGAAQNTSNSTKAFSKQAGVVGGLVPIYATFAANVFAVGAAFGVLSRAAAVQQLETSLTNIGIAAGRNLPAVAQNLKDITGSAISSEAALRATAIATTSGFSTSQLQNLTKVATGASIALGRNLPDALDRLVRGTAKLEPEILDELGIIVRLDQATREYAASLGKTAAELTQFERQQAFLNATIDQGLSKYEKIAQTVDPNPYDQLSAAFTDLTKATVELANKGLIPLIEFLSSSPTALFGVLGLFATTIVGQLIPAISDLSAASNVRFAQIAKAAKLSAAKIQNEYTIAARKIQVLDFMPKGFRELGPRIKAGTASLKEYDAGIKSLKISLARNTAEIKKEELAVKSLTGFRKQATLEALKGRKAELAAIQQQIIATEQLRAISQGGAVNVVAGGGSVKKAQDQARRDKRRSVGARVERKGLAKIESSTNVFGALGAFGSTIGLLVANMGRLEGAGEKGAQGVKSLGSAVKLTGALFSRLLGPLSLALVAFSFLAPYLENLTGKKDKLDKKIEKINESFDKSTRIVVAFNKEMQQVTNPVTKAARELEVAAGITDTTAGAFASLQAEAEAIQLKKLTKELSKQAEASAAVAVATEEYNDAVATSSFVKIKTGKLEKAQGTLDELDASVNSIIDNFGKVSKGQALAVLSSNIAQLKGSGAYKAFPELQAQYQGLLNELKKGPETVDLETYIKKAEGFSKPWRSLSSAITAAQEALRRFDAASAKLGAKDQTPFSAAIKASQDFSKESLVAIERVEEKLLGFGGSDFEDFGKNISLADLEGELKGVTTQARFFEKVLNRTKGSIETADEFIDAQEDYNKILVENEGILIKSKSTLMEQENILKRINALASLGSGFTKSQIDQEKQVKQQKINTLKATQILNESLIQDAQALKAVNDAVQAQIDAIKADYTDVAKEAYRLAQDAVKTEKEKLEIFQKQIDALRGANDLAKRADELASRQAARGRGRDRFSFLTEEEDSLKDQLSLLEKERDRKVAAAEQEADLKKAQVALEFTLLDAKYKFLAASARQLALQLNGETAATPEEKKASAAQLTKSAKRFDTLGASLGLGKLEVTVGGKGGFNFSGATEGGLLAQLLGQVNQGVVQTVRELDDEIVGVKTQLADMDTVERAFTAAAKAFSDGFSSAFTEILNGTKNLKDAFADLADSVIKAFQKVIVDKITQQFVGFITGKVMDADPGTFLSKFQTFFKKPSVEGASTPTTITGGGFMSPTGGGGALAQGANAGKSPLSVDSAITTLGGGLDGQGLGVTTPVLVTLAQGSGGIFGAKAGAGKDEKAGATAGSPEIVQATEAQTEATKQNTLANAKTALGTASMVTAGLATVAALTGNEKAAKALAVVTALLQAATIALTMAQNVQNGLNIFGFRNGGISTTSGKMSGYSTGGVAKGSQGGYPAVLHGTEAVVPLPNGKSIPVEMAGSGGGMQQNNVNVNVVMNNDGTSETSIEEDAKATADFGKRIAGIVQSELQNQKRVGGMLSPYGVA